MMYLPQPLRVFCSDDNKQYKGTVGGWLLLLVLKNALFVCKYISVIIAVKWEVRERIAEDGLGLWTVNGLRSPLWAKIAP